MYRAQRFVCTLLVVALCPGVACDGYLDGNAGAAVDGTAGHPVGRQPDGLGGPMETPSSPGVVKTVSYSEPTTLSSGTSCAASAGPLAGLTHTTIYYSVNGGAPVTAATVPAGSASGGGSVSKQVAVTGLRAGSNQVVFWATATNKQGESDPTCSTRITITVPW